MKRVITLITIIAGLALVPAASASNCRAIMTTPGYHDFYTSTINVQVSRYLGMGCNRALRIGAAGYLVTRSVAVFGNPPFAPGVQRSFYVGHLYCWLNARGSDFTGAACWHGQGRNREYVKFVAEGLLSHETPNSAQRNICSTRNYGKRAGIKPLAPVQWRL